jgi:hypothetical protein
MAKKKKNGIQPGLDDLISLEDAAKLSGLSSRHLRNLAINDDIWAKKLGRNWFTTKEAIREYLALNRRPGPKPKKNP